MLAEGQPAAIHAAGEARVLPWLLQLAQGPVGVPAKWTDDDAVVGSEAGLEALWVLCFGNRANIGELKGREGNTEGETRPSCLPFYAMLCAIHGGGGSPHLTHLTCPVVSCLQRKGHRKS